MNYKDNASTKKWRPFKDTAELFTVQGGVNGAWVKDKVNNDILLISGFSTYDVYIAARGWKHLVTLFNNYTFTDDTPCGVEEK